jgi:hypothetical protein
MYLGQHLGYCRLGGPSSHTASEAAGRLADCSRLTTDRDRWGGPSQAGRMVPFLAGDPVALAYTRSVFVVATVGSRVKNLGRAMVALLQRMRPNLKTAACWLSNWRGSEN